MSAGAYIFLGNASKTFGYDLQDLLLKSRWLTSGGLLYIKGSFSRLVASHSIKLYYLNLCMLLVNLCDKIKSNIN